MANPLDAELPALARLVPLTALAPLTALDMLMPERLKEARRATKGWGKKGDARWCGNWRERGRHPADRQDVNLNARKKAHIITTYTEEWLASPRHPDMSATLLAPDIRRPASDSGQRRKPGAFECEVDQWRKRDGFLEWRIYL
jgi:hypothetical protein